jgi:hypothetical protein
MNNTDWFGLERIKSRAMPATVRCSRYSPTTAPAERLVDQDVLSRQGCLAALFEFFA